MAQKLVAMYHRAPPPRPPRGLWAGHPEIDAVNHALTIGEGMSMAGLAGRTRRLLREAYRAEREPRLGRDWHDPLFKVTLPVTLGLIKPGQLLVSPDTLAGTARGEYRYFGPGLHYSLDAFEDYRETIELMWRVRVMIEPLMPGLLGTVRIRPAAPV